MENSPIVQVVKKVLPAVVTITVSKYLTVFESPFGMRGRSQFHGPVPPNMQQFMVPKGKKKVDVGGGSGFIVDPSGIILTNRHVVADPHAEYIAVLDEEKKYKAEIVAKDPINDIAVIKIKDSKSLPVIELGDSSQLQLGQTAIAIGNSLGTFRNTVSTGVVSGLSRQITAFGAFDRKAQRLRGLIQTDAAINPGNSGGPLVDIEGKVIGINAAMVFGAENVGFALPINAAKKDLEEIKKYKRIRQPFLGVRYVLLTPEAQKQYNLPSGMGALVVSEPPASPFEKRPEAVVPGSPADKVGIKEGDIILEMQKEKISIKNPLEDVLQKVKIGDSANLKILRDKKELSFKVEIEERK